MDNLFSKYIEELRRIHTVQQYDDCTQSLNQMLCTEGYGQDIIQTARIKEKYTVNKFSDESTKEGMEKAKENLILFLESIMKKESSEINDPRQEDLREYLHHFYLFLEAFREVKPHKKATLDTENLQKIQIHNEYDLQHLLYAVLKPLCMDARVEVSEDTGCAMVRSDIKILSLNTVIEAKCTRETMTFKKLAEEIEADIVHYQADFIYFYIYDREKIIKNKPAFESTYNRKFDGKAVEVIVLQPINM